MLAARRCRALGQRAVAQHLAGIVLPGFVPMRVLHFGHATPLAQALIVFALAGYVPGKRDALTRRTGWALRMLPIRAALD